MRAQVSLSPCKGAEVGRVASFASKRLKKCVAAHGAAKLQSDGLMQGAIGAVAWEDNVLRYERLSDGKVQAPRHAPPIVLLPGFGNNSLDYLAPFGDEEAGIAAALKRRGFRVYVVPLTRKDWFKVGRSLLTRGFWSNPPTLTTHPGYSWYLERVKETVELAQLEAGSEQVDLLGHSAGGWLGRAFLGQPQYTAAGLSADTLGSGDLEPHPAVRSLITLGTPHTPPPPDKVKDMTGGALTWVNEMWPGAWFGPQGVKYVCVAGRAVRGNREAQRSTVPGYSYGAYAQVCGEGHEVEGDGVVPLRSALLQGADQTVINGVFHSMSRIRTFSEPAEVPWYGSESVLDSWLHHIG
ncbi:hypothetical protein D9Q98_005447 [Chlorella vulgaris]|uniref:GPI inositol-deacylase n=1 Tax=Chlorella vulgaris TaxID=3077 RepID=A0A9D4YVV5_CHLVU|nr:hypothetical protein D9Q98_005447 [Chlorella vulgaris]